MFEKLKTIFSLNNTDLKSATESMPSHNKVIDDLMSDAIAAPKASSAFIPFDAVLPNQSIPGKFDYSSPTWKYLNNYFADRTQALHTRNESTKLDISQTSIIRGQLKEIKFLLKHINHLAGITHPPTTQSPRTILADEGNHYE